MIVHTLEHHKIYIQGYLAYSRGVPLTQNPHFGRQMESYLWAGGWNDAAAPDIRARGEAYKAEMAERERKATELASLSWHLWNARVRGEQNG